MATRPSGPCRVSLTTSCKSSSSETCPLTAGVHSTPVAQPLQEPLQKPLQKPLQGPPQGQWSGLPRLDLHQRPCPTLAQDEVLDAAKAPRRGRPAPKLVVRGGSSRDQRAFAGGRTVVRGLVSSSLPRRGKGPRRGLYPEVGAPESADSMPCQSKPSQAQPCQALASEPHLAGLSGVCV